MTSPAAIATTSPRLIDQVLRRLLLGQLRQCRGGTIVVEENAAATRFGTAGDLAATVRVNDPRFYRRVLLGGSLAAADGYVRGQWDCDDLAALFRLFLRNQSAADRLDGPWSRLGNWLARCVHRWHANTKKGSRRNIRVHYDLGNDFFQCWLDETWAYSCGVFPSPRSTLREASLEKFDRACRKLDLQPDDHILEIGTGWGGLAIHAARQYGCRVTSTTISQEQFDLASRRIDGAGLAERVNLLSQDYRDLHGTYDKLVSIEMIEAVGHDYLDAYFGRCGELLKPDGSMLLQAIVMPERRYRQYLRSVDFIRRYVFPGGCLPSLATTLESVGRTTRMRLVHLEDLAPHYAETLRRWRGNLRERLPEVRSLGYSEELLRLWDFYLCYCEAGFEERHVGVVQMVFDNYACRRDPLVIGQAAVRAFGVRATLDARGSSAERVSLPLVAGGTR
ncbi:MAG: class I SAM-dependent methyltransferase [Pirellulales bacterium]